MSFNYKPFLKWSTIATAFGIAIVVWTGARSYFTTPSVAVLVYVDEFPSTLAVPFSADALIDRVVAHLDDMISTADSGVINELGRQEGLDPRPVPQTVLPIRATSNIPSPVFNQKWSKGINLNFARGFGMGLKAKRFLEIEVVGTTESKSNWQLVAFLKEQPGYAPRAAGSAPRVGGSCSDLDSCAQDLAEQILRVLDYQRLLNFSIKINTENANHQILDLYQNNVPDKLLSADDLVAWGNAFYGLRRYEDALSKYQAALQNNPGYCPARIARGALYYTRPHGIQVLADYQQADQDFRAGVACDPKNPFAHMDLCGSLLREWTNSKKPQGPKSNLLVEAQEHCDHALGIDPHLIPATVHKGYILYRQGHHQESLRYFDKISQTYPTESSLFVNYGFLLYREYLGGREEALALAIEKTRTSLDRNPDNYVAANNLGYFYYERDDYEHAVEFWQKANLLKDRDPDCMAGLALVFYKQGQEKDAFMWLTRAISADSHYRDPNYLKKNSNWSNKAALDLATLVAKLPPA